MSEIQVQKIPQKNVTQAIKLIDFIMDEMAMKLAKGEALSYDDEGSLIIENYIKMLLLLMQNKSVEQ